MKNCVQRLRDAIELSGSREREGPGGEGRRTWHIARFEGRENNANAKQTEPCHATAPPFWRPERDVVRGIIPCPISVALNAHASFRFKLSIVGKVVGG